MYILRYKHVCTLFKPSQLQTILTAYYEDIKLVVSASTKSKVVKHKLEDQTCARR